jgi:oligopeptidase B
MPLSHPDAHLSAPPVPPQRPHTLTRSDGTVVEDPWYWLRERDDPAVRTHLEAENAYTEALFAPLTPLVDTLFDGIKGRIIETDASVPVLDDGWLYYRRTVEGQQYGIQCRRPAPAGVTDAGDLPDSHRLPVDPHDPPADEVVLLDGNVEAEGHPYFSLGVFSISRDHRLAVVGVDTDGGEVLRLSVRDLATGETIEEVTDRATYGCAWFDDDATFLYLVPDEAWRPYQVWRHRIGSPAGSDELVLQEDDERFWVGLGRTRSEAFVVIHLGTKVVDEVHLIDAGEPERAPRCVVPRSLGVEASVEHRGEHLYLVTNRDGATDFKLCTVGLDDVDPAHWVDLVPHRPGVRLEDADVFRDHLVLSERTGGRTQVRLCDPDTGEGEVLTFDEDVYTAGLGTVTSFEARTLRLGYGSLTTPMQVIDLDTATGERRLLKQQEVRGGYDRDRFATSRTWARSHDGVEVPVSIVHRADVAHDGNAPCLVYAYGAYEASMDPLFSSARLELLERGMVFAIAHVRGGGEMGRGWYEQGRMQHKGNTFHDLVACVEHLIDTGVADPARVAVRGGSAGGMTVGGALNLRPELFAAAVAEVPFVDVITTMSDPTIPLTVTEYDEWGDPADPDVQRVMATYSPYDNVRSGPYPAMYVTAGLNDPRVQYWEPAKWVARLRGSTTSGRPIVLETELEAGHGGRSGRYDAWRDEAKVLAFVLAALDVAGAPALDVAGVPVLGEAG